MYGIIQYYHVHTNRVVGLLLLLSPSRVVLCCTQSGSIASRLGYRLAQGCGALCVGLGGGIGFVISTPGIGRTAQQLSACRAVRVFLRVCSFIFIFFFHVFLPSSANRGAILPFLRSWQYV